MRLRTGTRFIHDGDTYEVKEVTGGLVRASWVKPDGTPQRGRPNHFKLADLESVEIVKETPDTTVAKVEDYSTKPAPEPASAEDLEKIRSLMSDIEKTTGVTAQEW
jgi:hypothetical protein